MTYDIPIFQRHVQFSATNLSTYDHRVTSFRNKMNHECVVMIQQMTQIKKLSCFVKKYELTFPFFNCFMCNLVLYEVYWFGFGWLHSWIKLDRIKQVWHIMSSSDIHFLKLRIRPATNLNVVIYNHTQYIKINKQTQFHETN